MLVNNRNFNIKQIADSGQCFRMNRLEGDRTRYGLTAWGRYLELTQVDDKTVKLSCTEEEYSDIWEDYFDLDYDYGRIVDGLQNGDDLFLKEAAAFGKGIRILKQEPFEAAISFIISQNKNIPAIRSCIEALCIRYGEKRTGQAGSPGFYAFPSPEALAQASKVELRALKTGYRDDYIIAASKAAANGSINFNELRKCSHEDAVKILRGIHGIGEKVANCISLYGLHHIEGFPVDLWIKRVLKEVYNNRFDKDKYPGYVGIVQQYMFYYIRHQKGILQHQD